MKHEQFRIKHQQNPKLLRESAQLLAKIHHLNVPICKDGTWLLRVMREWIEYAYDKCHVRQLVEQFDLDAFKRRDLLEEFTDFEELIRGANSPLVFSHVDFRGSNILVTEPDQKLIAIDMEQCAYAPRAFDIATFLTEWGKELFDFENIGMPDENVIEHYVGLYIEACDQLVPGYAGRKENALEVIVREVKLYILANILFFVSTSIRQEEAIIEALPFNPFIKMVIY